MPTKPVFNKLLQVAVVVSNLEDAMKKYWEEYGIGPWAIYTFDPSTVNHMVIRDESTEYAMRLALTTIGDVGWELIEPLDDKSIYAEFLRNHGEGLHHVAFDVDDYDKTLAAFRDKGIGVLQGGTFSGMTYTYLDTTDTLSTIVEIYSQKPSEFQGPPPEAVFP